MRTSATNRSLLVLPVLGVLALSSSACSGSSSSALTTQPTSVANPSTETFTGSIGQNGTAIHPFSVSASGYTLRAGFTSLAPASVTALGLGIGTWDAATSTCGLNLTQSDIARSGSTALNATASAGNYCARVYDAGNLAAGASASYTLQVEHY